MHAGAPPPPATRATLEKIIRRTVLPNGLEVIVIENHGVPLVTVEVDVRNGSFTQSAETAGLAHMFEHMFFKANREYPDADAFVSRAGEIGAIFNGSTREEVVNYYLTIPTDSLVPGMQLMNAALRTPLFRQGEIDHERHVVLGEYDRAESSPFFALTTAVGQKLWGGSWVRKNAIGDRNVVAHTTARQLRDIQREYYVPNNAALIIAGDVIPERVFALVADVFGDWGRQPNPFATHPVPPVEPLVSDDAVIVEQPVAALLFIRQWIGPSVSRDPDATYAADVVSDILNEPHSRFQRRLVDSGLWQNLLVNYYTLNQAGPITISGETTPEQLHAAIAALDAEVARLADPDYFDLSSIESIKQQRVAGTAFGLERASGFAHQVGFWWAVTGLDYFLGYVDKMASRKPRDLRAYVTKYLVGRPHITGVLLSHEAWQRTGMTAESLSTPSR
ncbi:MAG: pitrilysin family protein [Chloroflexota bacterium]